ncbi:hypothetical protein [Staphylococcus aureus]|nr:hypothetical protein DOY62_14165 [Staphylococcus aureus]
MMGIILYDHIIFSENDHHSIIKKNCTFYWYISLH